MVNRTAAAVAAPARTQSAEMTFRSAAVPRIRHRVGASAVVGLLAVLAVLASGCAAVVSSGSSTVSSLDLDAPRLLDEQTAYRVVDRDGLPVATARPQSGRLRFPLPEDREIGGCVAVLDAQGRSVTAGARPVALVLRARYEALSREREALDAERIAATSVEHMSRQSLAAAQSRLAANRAFADGDCRRPSGRPAPPRPTVACASADACLDDAAAACFVRYFGERGCAQARAALKRPGVPSLQACASAVRAGRSGDAESAVLDAVDRVATQAAHALRDSQEPLGPTLGNLLAGASESIRQEAALSCSRRLAEERHAPLAAWLAESDRLRNEPEAALDACRRDVGGIDALRQEAAGATLLARQAQARIAALDDKLAALRDRREPLDWCEPPFAAGADRR